MIIYCCGAMRSGSTLLFSVVDRLVQNEATGAHLSARVDNEDEIRSALEKYESLKGNGYAPTLVINGTFSPSVYAMLEGREIHFISCLRAASDCMGSAKARWGYRWTDSLVELQEVLDNLERTMAGLALVPAKQMIIFDYIQLFEDTSTCLAEVSKFVGYQLRPISYYRHLSEVVQNENKETSSSRTLLLSRAIRDSRLYTALALISRSMLSDKWHKNLAWMIKNRILKKYSTRTYIGPNHISKTGGVPGLSANNLTDIEVSHFSDRVAAINQRKAALVSEKGVDFER